MKKTRVYFNMYALFWNNVCVVKLAAVVVVVVLEPLGFYYKLFDLVQFIE